MGVRVPSPAFPFSMISIDLKTKFHKILENNKKTSARLVSNQLSFLIDAEFHKLFSNLKLDSNIKSNFCILAIGGYGRKELSPYSDIDILYLHSGIGELELNLIINHFNNFFYNSGKEIGYACRTIEECNFYLDNLYSFNAILDSRFLLGNQNLYDSYVELVLQKLPENLVSEYRNIVLERLQKLIDSDPPLHISEPNLKNGPFGLRDIQSIYWVEKVSGGITSLSGLAILPIFQSGEIQLLENAYDYYIKIRNALHHINGRKVDTLNIPMQPIVAEYLGYGKKNDINAIDTMMRTLYGHEVEIYKFIKLYLDYKKSLNSQMEVFVLQDINFRKINKTMYPDKHRQIFIDPSSLYKDILNIFLISQENDMEISPLLLREIQFASNFLEDNFASSQPAVKIFRKIIKNGKNLGKLLTIMHHCGLLGKLIPEFGACTNYSLFSYHHQYTIDEHTLLILRELDKLREGIFEFKDIHSVYLECQNTDILALAILIHDAGKVKEGDHCQYGAELANAMGERLGLSEDEISLFKFLVESHIMMSELSTKRDTSDPILLQNFASVVGDKNRLKLLYILTIIDTKSVGRTVLTQWKRAILNSLYESTLILLERTGIVKNELFNNSTLQNLESFLKEKEQLNENELSNILQFTQSIAPDTYIRYFTPRKVYHHFTVYSKLLKNREEIYIEISQEPSFVTITVYHTDGKLFLSELTGCVSSLSLNVLGLRTFKSKDGFLIEAIQVTENDGSKHISNQKLNLLYKNLQLLHDKKISVEELLLSPMEWITFNYIPEGMVEEKIEFDNSVSQEYTILEVRLPDSIGLLYRLIKTIISFDIQLHFVRVSTSADFAFDSFYLKDSTGEKITDSNKLYAIKESLANAKKDKTQTYEFIQF